MKSFRALSALLSYPNEELIAALPEIDAVLQAEGLLGPKRMEEIRRLLQELRQGDLYDLQERYVLLFDRSRSLSLNLFEHVHGESRDRGGAMVDLLETYRAGGFDLVGSELPDHLPVLLEYLSTRPLAEAEALLADASHILVALAERLTRRETAYAGVLSALVALVVTEPAELPEELAAVPDDDPEDLAALDAVWEEAQVTFGPDPNAGCPVSRDILARMDAPRVANPAQ
ncbi:nitrate reductase molybdenum cofactor assembly chaperone [Paracoccus sp. P2]|uniref:Nitrate reductase molybdenum cofactor assembly chaperone n=1 Tax=Paracoccus pantotrophus TaxID=82367 RepID=A0A7H9BRS2_PARPN|nr:nitrate reductase molybdenum cofactor assembly chaperone [Paracoccus pantotrophus]MDF3853917.1 nitrate reductase molybdenum cofactor assembly chaperone [Paracoccus pantotrophus]QLH13418.1 nitrate reductase molybdenum cofactor assembly chaperone [Paracoccus pantotrophus]RDD96756.1 nitrate reductase molybdenum cofactor assembly chaperone [Paracoccus pantotrophus]RNI16668.1 nitrate reductase molybdenum cofactor assembly chaperone [Paracoccus pantotrophus]WGR67367.1 nitrate reductase molybdenum